MQQLDIFADSRDVMLRNDVLEQLQRRDAVEARQARQKLADEFPDNETLAGLATLIAVLEGDRATPFADHGALAAVRAHLCDAVEPAARRLLGETAGRAWMASCWHAVAQQAAALPFRAEERDHHAAPLWLRAGDWGEARRAVERIESWRRIPAPLAWMAEARNRADGLELALPLRTELAWLSPGLLAEDEGQCPREAYYSQRSKGEPAVGQRSRADGVSPDLVAGFLCGAQPTGSCEDRGLGAARPHLSEHHISPNGVDLFQRSLK